MSNVHPIRFCLELCFCIRVRVLSFEMFRSISSEDRISALPDPIIHHILSFLPTKLSAATSILSKRWKPLWLSVPTLHFDYKTFPNYDSFRLFVSFVFLSRDMTLPIRSFHLRSSIHHSREVNQFVDAAAQRGGMENLDLVIFGMLFIKVNLPTTIFSCRTLVVLRLSGLKVNDLSQLVVDFPLLKTLHLLYVRFECFEHCIKLLSGCPILEEFERVWAYENLNERLVLAKDSQCLPNLIRAKISHMSSRMASVLFTFLCREKILCVELEDYCYSRHFPVFQNLIRMELILNSQLSGKWKWVIEMLKRCPRLQHLIIKYSGIEDEVVDNWMDPTTIPECLSTHLRTCLLTEYNGTECEIQFAKYIMQNAKVLKTISIECLSHRYKFKYLMILKLASSARASSTCELVFD